MESDTPRRKVNAQSLADLGVPPEVAAAFQELMEDKNTHVIALEKDENGKFVVTERIREGSDTPTEG